jgi:hypothetical protein
MTTHQSTRKQARQNAVLAAFRETGLVNKACLAADVARRQHYEWLDTDAEYRARFEAADRELSGLLVDEAIHRAISGTLKPVVFQGMFTYEPIRDEAGAIVRDEEGKALLSKDPLCVREYANDLLWKLIEARLPEKYGRKVKVEHSGNVAVRMAAARERLKNRDAHPAPPQ